MFDDWLDRFRRMVAGSDESLMHVLEAEPEPELTLRERRSQFRLASHLTAELRVLADSYEASLMDVSYSGARVIVQRPVRTGAPARLVDVEGHPGRSRVRCSIGWSQRLEHGGYLVGVRYEETPENFRLSWLYYALRKAGYPEPGSYSMRRSRRVAAALPYELQDRTCRAIHRGTTLDLSLGGALLKLPEPVPEGELVRLVLVTTEWAPAMILLAQVVGLRSWSSTHVLHHLRFFQLLPEQRLELEQVLMAHLRMMESPNAIYLAQRGLSRPEPKLTPLHLLG